MVTTVVVAHSRFGVHEVVFLFDVENKVAVGAVFVFYKSVVSAVGLVVDMTVLYVGKDVEVAGKVIGGFQEDVAVQLVSM